MPTTVDDLREKAMKLSSKDREALAYDLLDSVDDETDAVDDSMAEIIAERSAAVHRGEFVAHDWKETIAEMKQSLEERRKPKS
jgi:gas vesicle protein